MIRTMAFFTNKKYNFYVYHISLLILIFFKIAEWWSLYGNPALNLQQLAIKILSLTCSECGCECNWSVFEQVSF